MGVAVFRDGRKYLYGEEVDRERYVKLFNAHLEAIGYEYFDACGLRIGTKGKMLKSGEYACTVSYNAGQGPYRDFAKLHQEYLTTMGEDVSRRSYGDDATISIREVRFFVYEEGSVAF